MGHADNTWGLSFAIIVWFCTHTRWHGHWRRDIVRIHRDRCHCLKHRCSSLHQRHKRFSSLSHTHRATARSKNTRSTAVSHDMRLSLTGSSDCDALRLLVVGVYKHWSPFLFCHARHIYISRHTPPQPRPHSFSHSHVDSVFIINWLNPTYSLLDRDARSLWWLGRAESVTSFRTLEVLPTGEKGLAII